MLFFLIVRPDQEKRKNNLRVLRALAVQLCPLGAFACPVKFRRTVQRISLGRFHLFFTARFAQDAKNTGEKSHQLGY